MRVIERAEVARRLTYEACIPIVRQAMIDFSNGGTRQLLRSIIPLADGRLFGIMPGALGETAAFGAKLISVYPENIDVGFIKEVCFTYIMFCITSSSLSFFCSKECRHRSG